MTHALSALCLVLALALSGCGTTGPILATWGEDPLAPYPGEQLTPEAVDAQLDIAQRELDEGLAWEATRRALRLYEDTQLDSARGNRTIQTLIDAYDAAIRASTRPSQLDRIRTSRLPRTVRAMRAVAKAELRLARDTPLLAFEELWELEQSYPAHHLSNEAADLVWAAATRLRERDGSFLFFYSDAGRANTVYDYLVVQHPTHPRCDEAYWRLASFDAERRRFVDAILHLEDLVLYHPTSPYAIEAEARIPTLRLEDHARSDFDIGSLERILAETRAWLARHGRVGLSPERDALVERMRAQEVECLMRLARGDLAIARYYDRLDESFGAWQHAARAQDYAAEANDADLIEEARALVVEHESAALGTRGADGADTGAGAGADTGAEAGAR